MKVDVFIFIFQSNPFAAKLQTEDLEERLAEEKTKLAALEPEVGQGYIFGTNPPPPAAWAWGGGIKKYIWYILAENSTSNSHREKYFFKEESRVGK